MTFLALVTRWWHRITAQPERGDVPGWVLITLMTASLVAALWVIAEPALVGLFERAIDAVSGG